MENITFNDKLRAAAKALAAGEQDEIIMTARFLEHEFEGKKCATNPSSYVRTTMNRVPEVKEVGTIKIKKSTCDDVDSDHFGIEIYTITLSKEKRKQVFTKEDVTRIKRQVEAKVAEKFLMVSPNLANYAPEEYATIAKVMKEIHDIVKAQFLSEEE